MHSLVDWQQRYDDVEAMVQAAGGYVQASDDLRPRVLETARTQVGEQRGKRWIRQTSLAAAIVGVAVSIGVSTGESQPKIDDADAVYEQASQKSVGAGGFGWALVQAFCELRERQFEELQSD
jgi:hypothetical protein